MFKFLRIIINDCIFVSGYTEIKQWFLISWICWVLLHYLVGSRWIVVSSTFMVFHQHSDSTRLWSVSLVILGLVSGSLFQRRHPPSHTLHPSTAGQCWRPLPRDGGTRWVRTTQLHEAPVTHRAQVLPVFNTGTHVITAGLRKLSALFPQ